MEDEITLEDVDAGQPESVADAALAAVDAVKADASQAPAGADPLAAGDQAKPADAALIDPAKPVEAKPEDGKLSPEDLEKPSYLREKAAERFTKLTEGYKQLDKENGELKTQLEEINQGIELFRELGFSDEHSARDLIEFSTYRNAINSGNFAAAKEVLIGQLRQLQMVSGEAIDSQSIDPLAAFPDLAQRVEAFDLDRSTALELARGRAGQQQAAQAQERQQLTQRQQQEQAQAIETAHNTVASMAQQWRQTNPDFARIAPNLLERAKVIEEKFPPHMWADQISLVYEALNSAVQQFGSAAQQSAAFQPLRATGHAAGKPTPKNMAEAALQAVGMFGS